jgi:hypothetical protein
MSDIANKIREALKTTDIVTMIDELGDTYTSDFIASQWEECDEDDLIIAFGDHTHITLKDLDVATLDEESPHVFKIEETRFALHKQTPVAI